MKLRITHLQAKIFLFSISVIIIFIINLLFFLGKIAPGTETKGMWFYSGISMILISIFFIEPYFTTIPNAMINSLSITFIMLSTRNDIASSDNPDLAQIFYYAILLYVLSVLVTSIVSSILYEKNKGTQFGKNISTFILSGKYMYSILFLFFLIFFNSKSTNLGMLLLVAFWIILVTHNNSNLIKLVMSFGDNKEKNHIASIVKARGEKIVVAALEEEHILTIKKFSKVKFLIGSGKGKRYYSGVVVNHYFSADSDFVELLITNKTSSDSSLIPGYVYSDTSDSIEYSDLGFIGYILDNSSISSVRFSYLNQKIKIKTGDVVKIKIRDNDVYYQVVDAHTKEERHDSETYIPSAIVLAVQLGCWDTVKEHFTQLSWIPELFEPVYSAENESIKKLKPTDSSEVYFAKVPIVSYPINVDIEELVFNHTAILGVTGSGKTTFAIRLIEAIIKSNIKCICIDITGEYSKKLSNFHPEILSNWSKLDDIKTIWRQYTENKEAKRPQSDITIREEIFKKMTSKVDEFYRSVSTVAIFELPDLSNSSFTLDFTMFFCDALFRYAKQIGNARICLVIEEAHTIVPETNSMGEGGDFGAAKAIVSKIAQISLQGRKYGVGLVVIGQRTANISKTVLTQCNTVVAFRAYDSTSISFIENYVGPEMASRIPSLPIYHAIFFGKGVKSESAVIGHLEYKEQGYVQTGSSAGI